MAVLDIELSAVVILAIFFAVAGVIAAVAMFSKRYMKVPPDRVLVIYGRKSTVKTLDRDGVPQRREIGYRFVQGGGTFVIPVLEKFEWLNLSTHTVEPEVTGVVTGEGVPLTVEGVAQIKVKSDPVSIATAAEQLLTKPDDEITTIAQKTLEGHIRGVCAQLSVEAINSDRSALSSKIQEEAVPDFERLGLEITTFTIKDIKDEVDYLRSLGERRTAEVKRDASIGKAEAEKESTIRVAQARKDAEVASAEALERDRTIGVSMAQKEGNVAKAARDTEIAEAEKQRDVAKALYAAEVEQARADKEIAYQLRHTSRARELEAERVQVEIVRAEREAELREKEIVVRQKQEEAAIVVPARKKAEAYAAEADGEKRRISILAEGKASEIRAIAAAEAERMRVVADGESEQIARLAEGRASEVRAIAAAEAEKVSLLARAEAEKVRLLAEAEAERARKVGEAEAEAMRLKAEAYRAYGDAAKLDILARIMPGMTDSMAKSLQNTEKVVVITGRDGGHEVPAMIANSIATIPQLVKGLTGETVRDLVGSTAEALRGNGRGDGQVDLQATRAGAPAGPVRGKGATAQAEAPVAEMPDPDADAAA